MGYKPGMGAFTADDIDRVLKGEVKIPQMNVGRPNQQAKKILIKGKSIQPKHKKPLHF